MGKKLLHMALAVIAAVLPTIPSMAQIPEGYYSSLKGKKGDTPTWKTDNHGVIDFSKPYETYTVDGMKTTLKKNKKGIFIIKQGNATRKMVRY